MHCMAHFETPSRKTILLVSSPPSIMSHLLFWPTITYFYPIGNTSAVCLTENLSPEDKADILLLACGDPRHILYTIYANGSSPSRLQVLDVTCCDVDVAVLARNALLFTFLADDGVQDKLDRLWNLFYNMFVDRRTLLMLFEQCRKLIPLAESTDTWRAGPYGHFLTACDASTLAQLRRVWTAYLDLASFSPKQTRKFEQHFRDGMKDMARRADGGTTTAARSAGPLVLHTHSVVMRHFSVYWSSGIVDADGAQGANKNKRQGQKQPSGLTTNPTFVFSIDGDKFSVHYGTDPLCCFHLAEAFASGQHPRPRDHIPVHELVCVAKNQFSRWCTSVSEHLQRTNASSPTFVIRMYAGDALLLCQALKYCQMTRSPVTPYTVAAWQLSTIMLDDHYYGRNARSPAPLSFNVIDTSNILDHVGLVNILVAAVPLLQRTPSATLYTEALLRTGDDPSQAILEHICGDLPTMALLLGVIPSTFISQFATRSNVHEIFTASDGAKQHYERLAWKAIEPEGPTAPGQRLCFAPKDLAIFLFRVYRRMFADEDTMSSLRLLSLSSPASMVRTLRLSSVLHYNRRSFALLAQLAQTRVKTDWQCAMDQFEDLVLADGSLMMGQHAYQELCCQLHLLGVYTAPWIVSPALPWMRSLGVSGLFRDWTKSRIPQSVTLVLVVPREAIARLELDFRDVGTPALQCDMDDGPRQVWFAVTSATFGTLRVSGTGENRVGVVAEGDSGGAETSASASAMRPLSRTGAPLIITFSVMSRFLMDFGRNPQATVGLILRPTMGVCTKFADKLGLDLAVYRTPLVDAERVFVLAQRPVVGASTPTVVGTGHLQENIGGTEQAASGPDTSRKAPIDVVHVQMDDTASTVQSFTTHIDVTDPSARASLADVKTIPSVSSSTDSPRSLGVCVRIGTHTCTVRFPLPVDVTRAKLRVARRSSYIEVVAPLAPFDVRPQRGLLNRLICFSQDSYDNGVPTLGAIHRVNLDQCPEFRLPKNLPALNWYDTHTTLMFSPLEGRCVHRANSSSAAPDVLAHVKQTLYLLLRAAAGVANPDGKRTFESVFGLFDPSRRTTYLYIVIPGMRLDVGSHTVVADAFVTPDTPAVRSALSAAIRDASASASAFTPANDRYYRGWPQDPTIRYISTDADEAAAWFHLLPRLTERCRTWSHAATCAHRAPSGQRPLDMDLSGDGAASRGAWEGGRSPLCDCGAGVATGILSEHFERVAPFLTRAALSPFFPVPYLTEVSIPADGPAGTFAEKEMWTETEIGKGTPQRSQTAPMGSRCRSCGKEGGLVCSRCKGVRYCSGKCQREDWKAHKKDCTP